MKAFIFGGSGYIGKNLLNTLLSKGTFAAYYILDVKQLEGFESEISLGQVKFINIDVRQSIEFNIDEPIDFDNDWIFNFAAIHREPGHNYHEYFDTNIKGAHNINAFADRVGVRNVFFTSSIAPYGRSKSQKNETSNMYPETAYGISKGMCELIHQKWLNEDKLKRLIIVRPSVIYGPKDPGNVYRMIKSLKKGTFVLPNGGNVIKSYGYIFGLIDSILFTINQNKRFVVYNYAENPTIPLVDMTKVVKEQLNINKLTLKLPIWFLTIVAFFFQIIFKLTGVKSDIHPVRVRKAGFPTNIKPQYLIDSGFEFKYGFQKSLVHWRNISPEDFK